MRHYLLTALLALAGAFLGVPGASGALPYNNGDLFLGFRASGGNGAGQDYLVNIGPASQFIGVTSPLTVSSGDLATDLAKYFGSNWKTRADLFWSVSGGNLPADPENTLYATRAQPDANTRATAWRGDSNSAQGVINSKFGALAGFYTQGTASTNNAKATVQNVDDVNSYASFQPGGTTVNSNGQSFAAFSPSIEGNFANGVAGSILDLFRITPVVDQYSEDLGSFSLSATGVLTFTPAPAVSTVHFTSSTFSVDEDGSRAYLTVQRSGNLANVVTAQFSTTVGTGTTGATTDDFTTVSNAAVNFAAYQTLATVEVPITLRAGIQGNRSFTATLSSPSANATVNAPDTTTITIQETETVGGKLNFTFNSYQKAEAANADATVTVTVSRTNGQTNAASVQVVALPGGTATPDVDYAFAGPVTLNWADSDTAPKTFDITLKADAINDLNETILLGLQNATGAVLGTTTTTTVYILDGSPIVPGTVSFAAATYAKVENATGNAVLTIQATRTGAASNAVTVDIAAVAGGTASAADFALPANPTLSWAAGETGTKSLNLTIKSDVLGEGDETLVLGFQNATGGLTAATPTTTTVTISDPPDSTAPTVTITSPLANRLVSSDKVTITGLASDNAAVAGVEVTLNNGTPQNVLPTDAAATFNYSLNLVPAVGSNTVKVRAFDAKGNFSALVTRTFTFKLVRTKLAGRYNGLLQAAAGAPLDRNGLVSVTVTAAGTFTGKVTIAGNPIAIKGSFDVNGAVQFGAQKTPTFDLTRKVSRTETINYGKLSLQLDTGDGKKITGTLVSSADVSLIANLPHADLAIYSALANPPAPLLKLPTTLFDSTKEKGRYTGVFQALAAPNNGVAAADFPQGDGYVLITISKAGVVKFTGKLADGSIVSYSNTLSVDNLVPFYLPLYQKKGYIRGEITFDPTLLAVDASAPNLQWVKPQVTTGNYRAGWPGGIGVGFAASKYIVPARNGSTGTPLGATVPVAASATTANVTIVAGDGGLTAEIVHDANLNALGLVKDLSAAGTPKFALKLAPATGALTGSFTHPVSNRKVTVAGVAFQKSAGAEAGKATGFFLYTPTGGTALSGSIGITKK